MVPNGEGEPVWLTPHQRDSQPEGQREREKQRQRQRQTDRQTDSRSNENELAMVSGRVVRSRDKRLSTIASATFT